MEWSRLVLKSPICGHNYTSFLHHTSSLSTHYHQETFKLMILFYFHACTAAGWRLQAVPFKFVPGPTSLIRCAREVPLGLTFQQGQYGKANVTGCSIISCFEGIRVLMEVFISLESIGVTIWGERGRRGCVWHIRVSGYIWGNCLRF